MTHRYLALLLALWFPLRGAGEEAISIEAVADGYFRSHSYCDAGKRGRRDIPGQQATQDLAFERCARRDGRFKSVDSDGFGGGETRWTDGRMYYRYLPYYRRYQEVSLDDPLTYDHYKNRAEIYPVFVFELFSADPRAFSDPAERARYLRSFVASPALSNAQYSVFERFDPSAKWGERLWVLNVDRSIARYEYIQEGVVMRFTEVTSRQVDRPLTDADLWYEAPLFARYSLMNNPMVFLSGLVVASGILGAVVWAWLLARAAAPDYVLSKRRLLWKLQLWVFGAIAIILGVLAALSGPGGHPPAIAYIYGMGVWVAVAFAMTAAFLLASYPVDVFLKVLRR